ncbi:hypothetical protein CONLIGDRAFT_658907 [Coniochaeta ligniaria NRRL 30616]|uniref:Zn(2)-C6 fungal-type domain-containing protein n=1 Tax=Coniochaeta ligniaria NRRL 30616 TaxID=1408157 RepID=A0A1J7K5D0_9PEZI|nr:hypothetical protein CONLIGDRAFT_658907 [Coniochaeta ligniaria NRRL 30616]
MPSTEKPAGFFTTFSILDPNGTHEGNPRAQKRNRRVFVCIPCHRRKLKCDKGLPCSRCTQSGSSSSPPKGGPRVQDRTRSSYRVTDGKARVSGSTHWAKIACEFEAACPYIFGTDPRWDARYRQIKGLEYLFPPFGSMNFPFSNTCPIPPSQRDILNQLPTLPVVEALVTCYFQTCEVTHRLFQPLQFWDELSTFSRSRDQVLDGWLAQLLMILAIGCQNAPDYLIDHTGRSRSRWIEIFLEGAQISFGRSPYMTSPNLVTVRTLCLMVLARMLEIVKGSTSSQIVSLMGFVTRLAMSMQLHRTAKLFPEMPAFEAELRKRIWVTIQLLDVDVAMRAGTSFLCTEYDVEPPLNINESNFRCSDQGTWEVDTFWAPPHVYTDGLFQVKLAQLMPLVADIINTVNSPSQPLVDYETVVCWDRKLLQKVKEVESAFAIQSHSHSDWYWRASTQRQLLEILAHRAKLAIHVAFTRSPYEQRFELSYRAVRESSLALLGIQELWTGSSPATSICSDSSRSSSPSSSSSDDPAGFNSWLVDLCRDDFDTAVLCMILTIRKEDFGGKRSDDMPPRDTAWVILGRALMLFRQRACRSLHHFKQFVGLSIMIGALHSSLQVHDSLDADVSLLDMDPELLNITFNEA